MSLIKQIKLENSLYDIGAKWSNIDKENIAYGPSKIITFEDDKIELLKKCIVNIEPIQEGSGDSSPSNIRVITGQTGLTLHWTGKNLVDQSQLRSNGAEIVWEDDKVVATASNATYCAVSTPLFLLKGGNTYTLSCYLKVNARASVATGPYEPRIMFRNDDLVVVKSNPVSSDFTEGYVSVSYAVKSDTNMYLGMLITGSTDGSAEVEISQLQLEIGSNRTEFEVYHGQEVALEFPSGTVYGGTLDVLTGILTATHGKIIYDGSETWTSLGEGYYRPLSSMKLGSNNSISLCDKFPFTSSASVPGIQLGYNNNSTPSVYIRQAETLIGVKTANELKSWLVANPVEVVYPLAEPITYQLTPQIITSLIGWNNIQANCGDISIELENFYSDIQNEITTNLNENTLLYKSNNSLVSSNILIENDNLYFSKLNTYSPPKISVTLNSDNETYRNMDIGWSYNLGNGAVLGLREEHFPTTPGAFFLCARRTLIENENTSILTTQFRGTPDGSITISNDDYTACLNINTSTSATINPKDYNLYVNGTSYLKGDTKISANTSTVGCTLQYNNTLNTLNFVFD